MRMKIPPNSCVLTWNCSRAQIMDDAINLAKSGQLDYETALGLTGYLSKEEEYVPWFSALKGLSYIDNMLKEKKAHGLFKKLVFSFTKLKKKNLTFPGTCCVCSTPSTGSLASTLAQATPILTFYWGRKWLVTIL